MENYYVVSQRKKSYKIPCMARHDFPVPDVGGLQKQYRLLPLLLVVQQKWLI